jgi:hypothetical protein
MGLAHARPHLDLSSVFANCHFFAVSKYGQADAGCYRVDFGELNVLVCVQIGFFRHFIDDDVRSSLSGSNDPN